MSGTSAPGTGWGDRGRGGGGGGYGSMPASPASGLDEAIVANVLGRATNKPADAPASREVSVPNTVPRTHKPASGVWGAAQSPFLHTPATTAPSTTHHETPSVAAPLYDVYVVLDFEATCERDKRIQNPEIIEFPMVLVDARTHTVVAEFQRYVRPVVSPILSEFCTELTGITQEQVDAAQPFNVVFAEAKAFLAAAGLGEAPPHRSYCVVTCGNWDLQTMLPAQLQVSGQLGVPESFQRWCNIKKFMEAANPPLSSGGAARTYNNNNNKKHKARGGGGVHITGMPGMLSVLGLPLVGRHHSGIDDCRNIASVVCEMLRRGYAVRTTLDSSGASTPLWLAPERADWPPLDALTSSLARPAPTTTTTTTTTVAAGGAPSRVEDHHQEEGYTKKKKGRKEGARSPPAQTASSASGGAAPARLPTLQVDSTRDPIKECLTGATPTSAEPWRQKTLSKSLSHLLRHGADERHLPITVNGYARVQDVLQEPTIRKLRVSLPDIVQVVASSDKQRFRLAYGTTTGTGTAELYISAAQGHSLPGVMPDLTRITSVEACPQAVHGTYWAAWRLIKEAGYLSPMTRTHIHFAKGLPKEASVISGMRTTAEVVLYLDVAAALRDGVPLYESSNGVILTAGVGETRQLPLTYIAKVVDAKTGKSIEL